LLLKAANITKLGLISCFKKKVCIVVQQNLLRIKKHENPKKISQFFTDFYDHSRYDQKMIKMVGVSKLK